MKAFKKRFLMVLFGIVALNTTHLLSMDDAEHHARTEEEWEALENGPQARAEMARRAEEEAVEKAQRKAERRARKEAEAKTAEEKAEAERRSAKEERRAARRAARAAAAGQQQVPAQEEAGTVVPLIKGVVGLVCLYNLLYVLPNPEWTVPGIATLGTLCLGARYGTPWLCRARGRDWQATWHAFRNRITGLFQRNNA